MAESPEHQFLEEAFLQTLSNFSSLSLFGMTEVHRRTFDFGCNLERDWTLPLIGQVGWGNRVGLDKDLRTLFAEEGAAIRALVIKGDMAYQLRLAEIVKALEQRGYELFSLKVFPIAPDFDADCEDHRVAVQRELRDRIANDLLFNVVFGGISSEHVRYFARNVDRLVSVRHRPQFGSSGTFGTTLAVLHHLAAEHFISNRGVSAALGISVGRVREAILVLEGAGFIVRFGKSDSGWRVVLRGRVFLELLGRIWIALEKSDWEGELVYVLNRLGCEPTQSLCGRSEVWSLYKPGLALNEQGLKPTVLDSLVLHILAAQHKWGIDVTEVIRYQNLVPDGIFQRMS